MKDSSKCLYLSACMPLEGRSKVGRDEAFARCFKVHLLKCMHAAGGGANWGGGYCDILRLFVVSSLLVSSKRGGDFCIKRH